MSQIQKQKKKDFNLEHMPNFIKDAPWYMKDNKEVEEKQNATTDLNKNQKEDDQQDEEKILFHQRIEQKSKIGQSFDNWYKRGLIGEQTTQMQSKSRQAATKFRKGACTNCGAMTHQVKECTERPRKLKAIYSETNIAKDEYDTSKQQIKLNFESKRDRWNGYDANLYNKEVVKKWQTEEQLLESNKKKQMELKLANNEKAQANDKKNNQIYSDDSDDNDEQQNPNGQGASYKSADPKVKSIQKDLRIREDIAKYLRNLDPNSAPYDPKSRSMKENPNPFLPEDKQEFKGDNYQKITGDYINLIKNEGFMLEMNKRAQEKGLTSFLNTVAMPSQFELLKKEVEQKKEKIRENIQNQISSNQDVEDNQSNKFPTQQEFLELKEIMDSNYASKQIFENAQARITEVKKQMIEAQKYQKLDQKSILEAKNNQQVQNLAINSNQSILQKRSFQDMENPICDSYYNDHEENDKFKVQDLLNKKQKMD